MQLKSAAWSVLKTVDLMAEAVCQPERAPKFPEQCRIA